jgi:hypothetical protein
MQFILREIDERKEDTILGIATNPTLLLVGFSGKFRLWCVQNKAGDDLAIVDTTNNISGYKISGINPSCPDEFIIADDLVSAVDAVKNYLQLFYDKGYLLCVDDLPGIRVRAI